MRYLDFRSAKTKRAAAPKWAVPADDTLPPIETDDEYEQSLIERTRQYAEDVHDAES